MRKNIAGLFLWLLAVGITLGQEKAASVEDLIRQLGDRDFRVREAASQALLRLGDRALPALQEGMRHSDPEIRRRCRQLYDQVLKQGLEEKIKRFLAANDKDAAAILPGWQRFAELVGSDREARRFYAELARQGYEILDKVERASRSQDKELQSQAEQATGRLFEDLYQTAFNNAAGGTRMIAPEQFALLLFLAVSPAGRGLHPQHRTYLYNFCHYQNIRQTLTSNDEQGRVLRRMIVAWLTNEQELAVQMQGLQLALTIDLPELAPIARQLAENKQQPGYLRSLALTVVAKYGGKKEIAFFERFLADEAQVTTYQLTRQNKPVVYKTELRDWALTLLVHLTQQRIQDYPFPVLQAMRLGQNFDPTRSHAPFYFGFSEPNEREAAFKKWQQWRVDNPSP